MSLLVVIGAVLLFYVEGIGLALCILKKYSVNSKNIEISLSVALGLALNTFLFSNIYYLLPFFSIYELTFTLNSVLVLISLGLLFAIRKGPCWPSRVELSTLLLSLFATMLILRPLLEIKGLGFYFSNNGEFQYYAALADALKFHPSNFEVGGPFGLHSRESYTALFIAQFSSITGTPTLWLTQPIAGSYVLIFFITLTALVNILVPLVSDTIKKTFIYLLLASYMLNASTQLFFSLSFVSQYLAMALFVGVLLMLSVGIPIHSRESIFALSIVGFFCGNLLLVYPEMYPINLFLILCYVLFTQINRKSLSAQNLAVSCLIIILAGFATSIEGTRSFFSRSIPSSGGWNIFGSLREFKTFSGNLFGLSNPFFGPPKPNNLLLICLLIIGIAALNNQVKKGNTWGSVQIWRWMLLVATTLAIAIYSYIYVSKLGTNYILLKYILGYVWVGYLMLIIGFVNRKKVGISLCAVFFLLLVGQAQVAVAFSNRFSEDSASAIFKLKDAVTFQESYQKPNLIYFPNISPYVIPARFVVFKENLFKGEGTWAGDGVQYAEANVVLLLGKRLKLTDDPSLIYKYQISMTNDSFSVFQRE